MAVANRIQKVLEDANIKFESVATEVLGVSGHAILAAVMAWQADPQALADLARRRLRGKIPQLRQALHGRVTDHHRFLLPLLLEHLDHLDRLIDQLNGRIEQLTASDTEAMALLTTIPGIKQHTAELLLAEVGPTVDPFPTPGRFASWVRMCRGTTRAPGSGGPGGGTGGCGRRSCRPSGRRPTSRKTYLGARYQWVARRRVSSGR